MTPQDLDAITSFDSAVEVFLPIPDKSPTGPVVENNHEAVHVGDLALEINFPHSNADVTNFHGGSPSEKPNDASIAFLQSLLEVGWCLRVMYYLRQRFWRMCLWAFRVDDV